MVLMIHVVRRGEWSKVFNNVSMTCVDKSASYNKPLQFGQNVKYHHKDDRRLDVLVSSKIKINQYDLIYVPEKDKTIAQ